MKPSTHQNVPAEARQHKSNCAVVAIAAVAGVSYERSLEVCTHHGFTEGKGMRPSDQARALKDLGCNYVEVPELQGATVRQVENHLTEGTRLMVFTMGHVGALIHGERHDTSYRPRRRAMMVWVVAREYEGEAAKPLKLKSRGRQGDLEQKLWIDFLQPRGEATLAEMAEFLDVTEKRVRGVIDGLRRQGRPIVSVGKGRFRVEQED